jgi:RecB family endonuclease NucS
VLENPSIEAAFDAIRHGLANKKFVVVAGSCIVDYEGRASSKLSAGERLTIFKPDGSTMIHRPWDTPPVNWQPPGSLFHTSINRGKLVVRVYRKKGSEALEISFDKLGMVSVLNLVDVGDFNLFASESDMKQAIMQDPSLIEEGFRPITSEKAVVPGFIDIMGVDRNGALIVVEIKRVKASKASALQLKKYIEVLDLDPARTVRGILVAPSMGKGVQELLSSLGFEFKSLTLRSVQK